jgi:zinc/manganese transport system substrate-binding protein
MQIILILILTLLLSDSVHAHMKIVTTAPDFADLARQIGGDKVDVHSVMKGPENVHNVIAKPTEMVFLNKADMFVHSGLDSEPWRDNLLKGARNPRVLPGMPGNVDMSQGITLKDVPTGKVDRSMGDVHAYGNPHFQGSPENAQIMAVTLVKAMCEVDPPNAESYRANAKRLVTDLDAVNKQLKADLAPYAPLKVVTFHKAWDYFADAFGLEVVTTIEPKPLITPSPAEMKRTIDIMKEKGVKIVIVETYSNHSQAKYVAEQAGAQLLVLPDHVNGMPEADSYQNLFRFNVRKLIDAAKAAGMQPRESTNSRQDALKPSIDTYGEWSVRPC